MSESFDFMDDDREETSARELFRRLGFEPLPPSTLDDFQLRGRLWEFIYSLAGRRFYLCHSDHLSDLELYTWFHDEWLEETVPDIPSAEEWNCRIDMTDFNNGVDPIIWLKYFATDQERFEFATENNLKVIPAHVDPPFDRDRWLPEPPGSMHFDEVPDEDLFPSDADLEEETVDAEADPLGLAAADAAIRHEKQRQSEGLEEQNREDLAAMTGGHSDTWQRPIDQLKQSAVNPLPPDELTDETLTAKLWELLHNLACRGFYVLRTNHLSDRELYIELWRHGLRDEALLPGKVKTGGWFHDCIGTGSEEDMEIHLRYYASDEMRAEYLRDWPDSPMPPKETAPYNRDWRLPKGPF